jgi:hypothetical protein
MEYTGRFATRRNAVHANLLTESVETNDLDSVVAELEDDVQLVHGDTESASDSDADETDYHQVVSAVFDELDGNDVQMILRNAKLMSTGNAGNLDTGLEYPDDLSDEGRTIVVVICTYLQGAHDRGLQLELKSTLVQFAAFVSARNDYDISESIAMLQQLMVTRDGFLGLEEFYTPSFINEYLMVMTQNYFGMEVFEKLFLNAPTVFTTACNLVFGGYLQVSDDLVNYTHNQLDEELPIKFIDFLYNQSSTPRYQPALALLYVAMGAMKHTVELEDNEKAFKKDVDEYAVRNILYNAVYKEEEGSQTVMDAAQSLIGSHTITFQKSVTFVQIFQQSTAITNGSSHHNIYTFYQAFERLSPSDQGEILKLMLNPKEALDFRAALLHRTGYSLSQSAQQDVDDVQRFVVAMAIARGKVSSNYQPLLRIMATAMHLAQDQLKNKTRKLYDGMSKCWRKILQDDLLKCEKSKLNFNKIVFKAAFGNAVEAYNKRGKVIAVHVKETSLNHIILDDEQQNYKKMIELLQIHDIIHAEEMDL